MKRILIIEDERPARKKLIRFLQELEEETEVVAEIDTVAAGISFLKTHATDLIFSDIELLDGNAFDIYRKVEVTSPIIFTTAYDQFWMSAFENNGIDYLLKPFSKERFHQAWEKFNRLKTTSERDQLQASEMLKRINRMLEGTRFKRRFTVHHQQAMYFLDTDSITFFQVTEGVLFAYDSSGKKHILNETTLKEIEEVIDPEEFFRLNRGELVNKSFIERVEPFSKNVLAVKLRGYAKHLFTSQNSTAAFRKWVEK